MRHISWMNKNSKVKKSKDDWEYFDDCAICQAMKVADEEGRDLTKEELETVFVKQNLKNKLRLK